MTVSRWCSKPGHGSFDRALGRCPSCPPRRGVDPTAKAAQARFRKAVLAAAGNRCAWINPDGTQCPVTSPLEAAHLAGYAEGGGNDPSNGAALCPAHHRELGRRLR